MTDKTEHEILDRIFAHFTHRSVKGMTTFLSSEDAKRLVEIAKMYADLGHCLNQDYIDEGIEIVKEYVKNGDLIHLDTLLIEYEVSQTEHFFDIDRFAWHYTLTHSFYSFEQGHNEPRNFCEYWQKFMLASLSWIGIGSGVIAAISGLGYGAFMFLTNISAAGPPTLVIILLGLLIWGFEKIIKIAIAKIKGQKRKNVAKKPGIIRTKYKSWKKSYCPMVKYK